MRPRCGQKGRLLLAEVTPLTVWQITQVERSDSGPDQLHYVVTHRGEHLSDLSLLALSENHLVPCGPVSA